MDIFFEQSANNNYPKRNATKRIVLTIFKWAFYVLGILALFMTFMMPADEDTSITQALLVLAFGLVFAASFFVAGYFLRRYIRNINPEFDYIINGQRFIIVKVTEQKKRKKFKEYNISKISEIGEVDSENFERFEADKRIKKIFAIANPEDIQSIYYALITDDGDRTLLLFEPSQELLIAIKRSLPKSVITGNKNKGYSF